MAARKAIVHVGTHKTGTTTLQHFFWENREALRAAGLYFPEIGRRAEPNGLFTCGQHDLVDAFRGNDDALLDAFRDDLAQANTPNVLISSEDFESHLLREPVIATTRDWFARVGYETTAVIYLRAQPSYVESAYVELIKSGKVIPLADYVTRICEDGGVHAYSLNFEYSRFISQLRDDLGDGRTVARPFPGTSEPTRIANDVLRVLGSVCDGLEPAELVFTEPQSNARLTLAQMLRHLHALAHAADPGALPLGNLAKKAGVHHEDPRLAQPFAALAIGEIDGIEARFSADNALVEQMTGTRVPSESAQLGDRAFHRMLYDFAFSAWFT